MKAWKVTLTGSDFAYVLAETGPKATARAINSHDDLTWGDIGWYGRGWKDVRRKRMPELDGDRLTYRQLFDLGLMWTTCYGCEVTVQPENPDLDPVWITPYHVFCTPTCHERHAQMAARVLPDDGTGDTAIHLSTEW